MAIDGVKIIDSDSACDIYNDIVERYKNREDVEKIKQDWLKEEKNFCFNELEEEIYWTALAYALWKIGFLDDEIKNKTLTIIQKGASKKWNEIDEKSQKKRQKILDKLAIQISSENPKPIKIPKPVTTKTPYFEEGDVLAVEMPEGYGICFVSLVDEGRRKIEYHLACTRALQKNFPTMTDFLSTKIACKKINLDFALQTDCWFNHKDLGNILPHFKKIGRIKLFPYQLWLCSSASNLQDLYNQITRDKKIWGLKFMETNKLVAKILEE